MCHFVRGRLIHLLPVFLFVSVVAFGLMAFAPIDPARMALSAGGTGVQLEERDVVAKRHELGLDRPLWERYLRWWAGLLRLDLGNSFMNSRPVTQMLRERLPASVALAGVAMALSAGIGIPLGMLVAVRAGTWLDAAVRVVTLLGASLPAFWLALFGIWLFAVELKWVSALGSFTPRGMALPALVLALRPMARLIRLMRSTTLETLGDEYVRTARSKGLSGPAILRRHVLPNALLPILSVLGLDFTALLANGAVVEWVFAWPGIGRLGVDAALSGDLPVIMGFVLLTGWSVILVNLTVDLLHVYMDPRQRAEGCL